MWCCSIRISVEDKIGFRSPIAMGGTSFGGVRTGQNVDGQLGTPYYIIKRRKEPFSGGQSVHRRRSSGPLYYSPRIYVWLHTQNVKNLSWCSMQLSAISDKRRESCVTELSEVPAVARLEVSEHRVEV
jgi:hypothetical protein